MMKETAEKNGRYLRQVENVISVLEMHNSKKASQVIQGRRWHVIACSPNIGFYNTTLNDAFELYGEQVFRYIDIKGECINPFLCTIKKTGKEMVEFDFFAMGSDNDGGGARDKYIIRDAALKKKCEEIFNRDGGYKLESSEEYRKAAHSCVLCMDAKRRKCKYSAWLKDMLLDGIMYMYDSANSVNLCTEFNGGLLAFPIDDPQTLNKEFRDRDVAPDKTRKTTVYSDVSKHKRTNGADVDYHIRTTDFTYKNREFWICLEGESVLKKWDLINSEKARKRMEKWYACNMQDAGNEECESRIFVEA